MSRRDQRIRPTLFAGFAFASLTLMLTLAITGCGGGGSGATGGVSEESSSTGNAEVARAKAELATLYKGTAKSPETKGPAPKPGQNVWAISVGYGAVASKLAVEAFKEGAEELDWKVTLRDGKFEPSVWLSEIREAVRANADAIFLETIDCGSVKAGLEEAKKAGIIIIASSSHDCEPAFFSGEVDYVEGSYPDWLGAAGEAQSVWAIAQTDAKAKVLLVYENDINALVGMNARAKKRLEECTSCEIVGEVTFTGAELGPPLQQKVEQALLQYPDTTVVNGNYDAAVELGVAAAVRASGKDISVLGLEGQPNNIELVRKGEQAMGVGYGFGWYGYAAVDGIVRLEGGESSAGESGIGIQVYDAEHNLPPSGKPYEPSVDYRKAYREAWGLE